MRSSSGTRRIAGTLLAAVIPFSVSIGAQAQSLIDAFVTTYNSNPDLLAQRARLRTVDETVSQAVAGWRPVVRGQAEMGFNRQNSSIRLQREQNLRPRTYALTVTQQVYNGGKTVATVRGAESDVRAERAALVEREQIVLLGAVTAYSDFVRDIATVQLRRNNVRVLQEQLTATNARFRVGEVTQTDVSQSEARLARSQADLTAAIAQAANSRAAYQRVVGVSPSAGMQEAPLLGSVPQSEDQAVALAIENAPRSVAAKYRVSSANYAIDSATADLLPTFQVVGSVSRAFDTQIRNDHLYSFAIRGQLTVPLYQGGGEYSRVRASKQVFGQRKNELESSNRQSLEGAIRSFRQLEAARARVGSLRAQVQASTVALDGVRQEAQVGSRTTLDVLNAEQELLDAQVQLAAARRDVVVAHYTLLSEIGQLTARQLRLPVLYYDEEKYYNGVRNAWFGLGSD